MSTTDKRGGKRVAGIRRFRLKYKDVDAFVEKYAANVSKGGIFIISRQPQPKGTVLRFEMLLTDSTKLITGEGKVVWIKEFDPDNPGKPHGMGIKFTKLNAASKGLIDRIVAYKADKAKAAGAAKSAEAKPTPETEPEVAPEAEATPEAEPKAEPEAEPKAEPEAEPEAEAVERKTIDGLQDIDDAKVSATLARIRLKKQKASSVDLDGLLTDTRTPAPKSRKPSDATASLAALLGRKPRGATPRPGFQEEALGKSAAEPKSEAAFDAEPAAAAQGPGAEVASAEVASDEEPDTDAAPEAESAPEAEPDAGAGIEAEREPESLAADEQSPDSIAEDVGEDRGLKVDRDGGLPDLDAVALAADELSADELLATPRELDEPVPLKRGLGSDSVTSGEPARDDGFLDLDRVDDEAGFVPSSTESEPEPEIEPEPEPKPKIEDEPEPEIEDESEPGAEPGIGPGIYRGEPIMPASAKPPPLPPGIATPPPAATPAAAATPVPSGTGNGEATTDSSDPSAEPPAVAEPTDPSYREQLPSNQLFEGDENDVASDLDAALDAITDVGDDPLYRDQGQPLPDEIDPEPPDDLLDIEAPSPMEAPKPSTPRSREAFDDLDEALSLLGEPTGVGPDVGSGGSDVEAPLPSVPEPDSDVPADAEAEGSLAEEVPMTHYEEPAAESTEAPVGSVTPPNEEEDANIDAILEDMRAPDVQPPAEPVTAGPAPEEPPDPEPEDGDDDGDGDGNGNGNGKRKKRKGLFKRIFGG